MALPALVEGLTIDGVAIAWMLVSQLSAPMILGRLAANFLPEVDQDVARMNDEKAKGSPTAPAFFRDYLGLHLRGSNGNLGMVAVRDMILIGLPSLTRRRTTNGRAEPFA